MTDGVDVRASGVQVGDGAGATGPTPSAPASAATPSGTTGGGRRPAPAAGHGRRGPLLGAPGGADAALAVIGVIVLAVTFARVGWFAGGLTSGQLGSALSASGSGAGPVAAAYFGWLGWVLVVLAAVPALLAHLPRRPAASLPDPLRRRVQPLRLATALVALVLTFVAVQLTGSGSYGFYLGQARAGFWLAVVGFALLAVSALGTRLDRRLRPLTPLLWVGPAIALIGFVVLTPVVMMFRTAFRRIDTVGFDHGWTGTLNFRALFNEPELPSIIVRTVLWVVAIVALTIVVSLALAQLFNQQFPGRRITRWALIAPWAASVFMTAVVFRWMLNGQFGVINLVLHDLGIVHHLNSSQSDWLARPTAAFWWMVAVAVFVSVPFTTYALLAGLQTIPADVYEAARMDGAGRWRTYWSITLPLLRPSLIVAVLINLMNVFNNFPIIWEMRKGAAGYDTDTTTTFMYKLKASSIGESAAMSVVNFGFVIVIVGAFLYVSRRREEGAR